MKTIKKKTTVSAIYCPKCNVWVYSRTRHDFRHCPCNQFYVDGGKDYMRIGYATNAPKIKNFTIPYARHELYADWNTQRDRLGYIYQRGKKYVYSKKS